MRCRRGRGASDADLGAGTTQVPVVWTNTEYRMLYINMGHGARIFDSPLQNRLLQQAAEALARRSRRSRSTASPNARAAILPGKK